MAEQRHPDAGEHPGPLQAALSRIDSRARRMCAASTGRRPGAAPRRPRRWWTDRRARRRSSPTCRRRAAWSGSIRGRTLGHVRLEHAEERARSIRSSASMVTLVSSSPFHQPAGRLQRQQGGRGPASVARRHLVDPRSRGARPRAPSEVPSHDEQGDLAQLVRRARRPAPAPS